MEMFELYNYYDFVTQSVSNDFDVNDDDDVVSSDSISRSLHVILRLKSGFSSTENTKISGSFVASDHPYPQLTSPCI